MLPPAQLYNVMRYTAPLHIRSVAIVTHDDSIHDVLIAANTFATTPFNLAFIW
jgi:hypothetical protein